MKISAVGQARNYGEHRIVQSSLADVKWGHYVPGTDVSVTWSHCSLHFNGEYRVTFTVTPNDVEALASRMLPQKKLIDLAKITTEQKLEFAKEAAQGMPLQQLAEAAVKSIIPRSRLIEMLGLTADEKIEMARDVLKDVPFAKAASMLFGEPEQQAA